MFESESMRVPRDSIPITQIGGESDGSMVRRREVQVFHLEIRMIVDPNLVSHEPVKSYHDVALTVPFVVPYKFRPSAPRPVRELSVRVYLKLAI